MALGDCVAVHNEKYFLANSDKSVSARETKDQSKVKEASIHLFIITSVVKIRFNAAFFVTP
tara:strand:- start:618 stop:800 length:183 start_codon:yes stop_codon:yes gene_type:complete